MVVITHNGELTILHDKCAKLYNLQNGSVIHSADIFESIMNNNNALIKANKAKYYAENIILKAMS